jgi:dihydroneopterin aldolase
LYKIYIENLTFSTIIGILEEERHTPQNVIVNLHVEYEGSSFLNYATICEFIENDMKKNSYLLIEDALEIISKNLHSKFPQIQSTLLKITKPDIIKNAQVSVELYRKY